MPGPVKIQGKGEEQEEGKGANFQLRPMGKRGVYSCPCGLSSRPPPCSAPRTIMSPIGTGAGEEGQD